MTVRYGTHFDRETAEGHAFPPPDTATRQTSLSDIIDDLAHLPVAHLTVRDMTDALGERSFGASLAVFALPNLMPFPPGTTILLALPLLFVTWQMMASGGKPLWFPARFADHRIKMTTFAAFAGRAIPILRFAERWVRPRLGFFHGRMAERLVGGFALLLALAVFFPVPLGNWLPALALTVIGLTLTARDGLGLIAGVLLGIASIVAVAGVILLTGAALAVIL